MAMPWRGPDYPGEYPTLGEQIGEWIEGWCVIPDGEFMGQKYILTDEMWRFLYQHYRLDPETGRFKYRRSQLVRPQKWGKGPFSSGIICAEAEGPVVFDGWDASGNPVGKPWTTPWIQVTAVSEDQTQNIWRALQPMIELGPLADVIPDTGLTRINLRGGGRIEGVTASARSRLGQRVTFVPQDEALALDTPVPTPSGWTTVEQIVAGDFIFRSDGHPARVLGTTAIQYERKCFRVTFADHTSIVTSDGHLWLTRVSASAARPRVRTTGEMFADGRRFRIPAPGPHEMPEADLPVDPYFLGLWLADGSSGQTHITEGEQDIEPLAAELAACGVMVRIRRSATRAPQLAFSSGAGYQAAGRPAVAKALQSLECYRRKHVPEQFFQGSIAQRTALLQGFMDGDGYICPETGVCTFTGNGQHSKDVLRLLRSLGQVVRRVFQADPRSGEGGGWKINFAVRGELKPFRLTRKARHVRPMKLGSEWVSITSIEPVESVPVRCLMVDTADHLFLAGEAGHATHNTHSWVEANGGLKLADNQRRNLAGMGGRAMETTNAWDPAELSVAQVTAESPRPDIYRDHVLGPPASLKNKKERRKALKVVYGDSWWVDLDRIDAEAEELSERDPVQAERFYFNRVVATADAWLDGELWDSRAEQREIEDGSRIVLGFDGSQYDDWTGFRAETLDGHQFTPVYGADNRLAIWNPADWGGEVPRSEVNTAMADLMGRFDVVRCYVDPPFWQSELDNWASQYGDKRVLGWETRRDFQMAAALERITTDIISGDLTHDGCPITAVHVRNARKDRRRNGLVCIRKDRPGSPRKVDMAVASALVHEAAGDCIADGLAIARSYGIYSA
jgi:hypothetical protein